MSKDFFGNSLYEGDIVACLRKGDMTEFMRNSRVSRKQNRDIIKRMDIV